MEYLMQDENKITWEGAGTYVAMRNRGKTHFFKLPEGKTPRDGMIVRDFASQPATYVAPEPEHPLWK